MRKYLDETDTVGAIRLELNHPASIEKVWVLVEGNDDWKLYSKLIAGPHTRIEEVYINSGGGCTKLKKTLAELRAITSRIIGIRDSDFLRLSGNVDNQDGLFCTDCHDAEMMIATCDYAFYAVVSEFLPAQISTFAEIRTAILESLRLLECIRWDNDIKRLGLNFRGLSFGAIYDGKIKKLSVSECISQIENASDSKRVDIDAVTKLADKQTDMFELCNGHDFINALREYINCTRKSHHIKSDTLSSSFRLAYSFEHFKTAGLYNALAGWGVANNHILFAA